MPPPPLTVAGATAAAAAAPPQLTPEHFRQLAAARAGWRRVRRAVAVARFDGWTIGLFGGITLLCGLTNLPAAALGVGMLTVATIELRTAARLGRLDPSSTRTLGLNQLAVALMLIAYAGWRIYAEMTGSGEYDALIASEPDLASVLKPTGELVKTITVGVYLVLIAVALLAQGSLALFYFTRGKHVRAYLAQTPAWIAEMQRAGVKV